MNIQPAQKSIIGDGRPRSLPRVPGIMNPIDVRRTEGPGDAACDTRNHLVCNAGLMDPEIGKKR